MHHPTPSPSISNLSFKSNGSNEDEWHVRAEKAIDDWSDCLKLMLKYTDPHDDFAKTLRKCAQVDTHEKNTKQALEKAEKALDLLLEKKQSTVTTIEIFKEVQTSLQIEQAARTFHWEPSL